MTERVQKIKLALLVLDYYLYPREQIQSYHVAGMVEALEAGAILPPIIVDRKSKRVVDGFHRVRAHYKAFGKDGSITAILRDYEDEAAMFIEAVKLNSAHGRNLSPFDRVRCLIRAEELKMKPELVASALNMTSERLGQMKAERLAYYKAKPIGLKRTVAHLAGRELTDEEVSYIHQAGGMNQTFYINQVIAMIEADTVDWENSSVVKALKRLHELLEKAMKPVRA